MQCSPSNVELSHRTGTWRERPADAKNLARKIEQQSDCSLCTAVSSVCRATERAQGGDAERQKKAKPTALVPTSVFTQKRSKDTSCLYRKGAPATTNTQESPSGAKKKKTTQKHNPPVARAERAVVVSRVGQGHASQVRADADHHHVLGLEAALLVRLLVTEVLHVHGRLVRCHRLGVEREGVSE